MDIKNRKSDPDTIRLDTHGNWYQGEFPILHDRTIQFLYRNVTMDDGGRFYLSGEDKPIYFTVEDVPYFITKVERTIAGYLITLTDDSIELLNSDTLWSGADNALYCMVKGGSAGAKFFKAPYYEIAKDIEANGKNFVVVFRGKTYPIALKPPKEYLQSLKPVQEKKKAVAAVKERQKPAPSKIKKAAKKVKNVKKSSPPKKKKPAVKKKPIAKKTAAKKPAKKSGKKR